MEISGDILAMCKLVAFAEEEKKHALATNFNVEGYAQEVLKRFQAIYPDAILILGDFKIGSPEWHKSLEKSHVHLWINGIWEFYSVNPHMTIEVTPNGKIDLSEGIAEQIFNYVND
jgi:hypothetical protein